MTVQGKSIILYDWDDIEKEICNVMGITEKHFRDYHEVVGGDYKDLWHVALDLVIPDNLVNDSIVYLHPFEYKPTIDYSEGNVLMNHVKEHGEWIIPFIEAYQKVILELNGNSDNGVVVEFSW